MAQDEWTVVTASGKAKPKKATGSPGPVHISSQHTQPQTTSGTDANPLPGWDCLEGSSTSTSQQTPSRTRRRTDRAHRQRTPEEQVQQLMEAVADCRNEISCSAFFTKLLSVLAQAAHHTAHHTAPLTRPLASQPHVSKPHAPEHLTPQPLTMHLTPSSTDASCNVPSDPSSSMDQHAPPLCAGTTPQQAITTQRPAHAPQPTQRPNETAMGSTASTSGTEAAQCHTGNAASGSGQVVSASTLATVGAGWHSIQHMVIYGLGSVEDSRVSRYQLALALSLAKQLPGLLGPPEIFDPAFSDLDKLLLPTLGLKVIEKNENGARTAQVPTFFYMPHCEGTLCDSLLAANWTCHGLPNVVILGNKFSSYQERWGAKRSDGHGGLKCPLLLLQCADKGAVVEIATPDLKFPVASAFNDMALHVFPKHLVNGSGILG